MRQVKIPIGCRWVSAGLVMAGSILMINRNGWSSRFRRLLSGNNVVIKSTIFVSLFAHSDKSLTLISRLNGTTYDC